MIAKYNTPLTSPDPDLDLDPVLMPCKLAVLAPGLKLIPTGGGDPYYVVAVEHDCTFLACRRAHSGGAPSYRWQDDLHGFSIDLRDPATRDAVVRALWRNIKGYDTYSAPYLYFSMDTDDNVPCWRLTVCDLRRDRVALNTLVAAVDGCVIATGTVCDDEGSVYYVEHNDPAFISKRIPGYAAKFVVPALADIGLDDTDRDLHALRIIATEILP